MSQVIECYYLEEPHTHEFPDDWKFGGADGLHPGADPRYLPTVYEYYNDRADIIWTTSVPLCDYQAIDEFTLVGEMGKNYNPVWVSAKRPDGSLEMLHWVYNKATDTVSEKA